MRKILLPIITILLINFTAQAQLKADTSKIDPSLRGQYQLLLSKSKTLNGYKLVNPSRLSVFWQNVRDSLNTDRKQLVITRKKIEDQGKEISDLKKQISGTESSLANSNAKLNEISFLGIGFTKSNYNLVVWGLIIALGAALAIIILRSAKHIHEAKYRSTLYDEISQEYQNYKVKANDKEKKLARELQDERNKLDELKNRGK
ncbi:hypothetical protein [Pedobacter panaciterrae]|jgi:hypothetical protein|uniref:tRNA (Guanine-N1)-methyltransferase n=1 Tax=Pedobacter panaciterrae TaxID=363849 RepID=A0ABU8NQ81_9SPHI|nr:hypothetical protein [Pedobacter panaciterrae]NQX54711.1 hypothetical protein [Pedobacter panaciterrae]